MTRVGFRVLAGVLALLVFAGGWLFVWGNTAPTHPELEERTCAEWEDDPTEGGLRLTGCTVDLSRARITPWGSRFRETHALVEVVRPGGRERFFAVTDDPRAIAFAMRLSEDRDGEQRARTLERFADLLRMELTIEGHLHRDYDNDGHASAVWDHPRFLVGRDYVLSPVEDFDDPHSFEIAAGIAMCLIFGPILLLVIALDRRWRSRGERGPRVF